MRTKQGPIIINSIEIHNIYGSGLVYQLEIRSGEFVFKGNFDRTFRAFTDVVEAAMKYFGIKYGLVTLDSTGIVRATKEQHDLRWDERESNP